MLDVGGCKKRAHWDEGKDAGIRDCEARGDRKAGVAIPKSSQVYRQMKTGLEEERKKTYPNGLSETGWMKEIRYKA